MGSWENHTDKLPWREWGFSRIPYVGGPLRHATTDDIRDAVAQAIKKIDEIQD